MTNKRAINLLRGQENAYCDCMTEEEHEAYKMAIDALEARVACEPNMMRSGGVTTWRYVCGACYVSINPNEKYCHQCGRPVKWNTDDPSHPFADDVVMG